MAGNSWQSPVADEPSWGTPHTHYETLISDVDPASAGNATVTVTNVPTGTRGIFGYTVFISTATAGRILYIKDSGGNIYAEPRNPTTAIYGYSTFSLPLDSNKQFIYSVNNADVDHVYIIMNGYYL